jgi:hypothetical protein
VNGKAVANNGLILNGRAAANSGLILKRSSREWQRSREWQSNSE